jgi:DNA helicase HerA-like ATPase
MREHLKPHNRRLVVGITGCGKSHYCKGLVRHTPRVVVWDIHAEYAKACDLDEVSSVELEEEAELLTRTDCRLAVVPEWEDPAELAEALKVFVRTFKRNSDDARFSDEELPTTLLVVEEVAAHRPQGDGTLAFLAMQARHWNVPLVLVAQRAMGIPPSARAQADSIVSFRQTEADDLDGLREYFRERTEKIATLQRGKALIWQQADAWAAKEKHASGEN